MSAWSVPIQKVNSAIEDLRVQIWHHLPLPNLVKRGLLYSISHKFIIGVVGLIVDEEGRILVFKHTYYDNNPWGLPGGIVKQEGLPDALEREILEESGFKIEVNGLRDIVYQPHRIIFLYYCNLISQNFTPSSEVVDFKFIATDELEGVGEDSRKIIQTLKRGSMRKKFVIKEIDLSETKIYNDNEVVEKKLGSAGGQSGSDGGGDMEQKPRRQKKQTVIFGNGYVTFEIAPRKPTPLPPQAARLFETPSSDQSKSVKKGTDSEKTDKTDKTDKTT